MTFEEISEIAFKGEKLNGYPSIAQKYAYIQMCNLYRDYKNNMISKENATKQKNDIKKEYEINQSKVDDYYNIMKKQNEIRTRYHDYICEIEKSNGTEDLLDKSLKFIEVIISDESFYNRNIEKCN